MVPARLGLVLFGFGALSRLVLCAPPPVSTCLHRANVERRQDTAMEVPEDLKCPVCNKLVRTAVRTSCCNRVICDPCQCPTEVEPGEGN